MPGLRLFPFQEGDRSEYLAHYLLSYFASVVPVPRQEDYGLDFLCASVRRKENRLHVTRYFGVQVKSSGAQDVAYGGMKRGRWKHWEVEWLYDQDVPLLIAVVDRKQGRMKLYSTMRMWWAHWQFGFPYKVLLRPDLHLEGSDLQRRYRRRRSHARHGDGHTTVVPLGRPIADVTQQRLEHPGRREAVANCLESWIDLDRQNIVHWKQGVPYTAERMKWRPNVAPRGQVKYLALANPTPDQNIRKILNAIQPGLTTLAFNFKLQEQWERMEAVRPLSDVLHAYQLRTAKLRRILGKKRL
jgi:hypothetical protein